MMDYQDNHGDRIAHIRPPAREQAGRTSSAQADSSAGWRTRAIKLYRQAQLTEDSAMQAELSDRVLALTDRIIAPASIYVDHAARMASVVLDGVLLRWRRQQLVLARPCPVCGLGLFESPAITSPTDLGYALIAWQPPCACSWSEDPVDDMT
jgi:hypothetical protein